ncbi:exosortase system-associated protein, TIGR04073 family [Candidatus Omnitrophota bacterium]
MRPLWKKIAVMVCVLGIFMSVSCPDAYAQKALRKLGRGVTNTILGWTEILIGIELTGKEDGVLAGASYGLLKGTANTVLRTGVGAFELVTCFLPVPEDYRVIVVPEYPMQKEWLALAEKEEAVE